MMPEGITANEAITLIVMVPAYGLLALAMACAFVDYVLQRRKGKVR